MGAVELSPLESKSLEKGNVIWTQRVLNHAIRIIADCKADKDIEKFFCECEDKIKYPQANCRTIWNTRIQSFGGDEFGYVFFFYSDVIDSAIKASVKVDILGNSIGIGNMEIADIKETVKLEKELEKQQKEEDLKKED
jgi:hypothetical protein